MLALAASESRFSDLIHASCKTLASLLSNAAAAAKKSLLLKVTSMLPSDLSVKRFAELLLLHFHPTITFVRNLPFCFASSL